MTDKTIKRRSYPWTIHLDDLEVTFRLMTAADAEGMLAFTKSLPEHDLLFLRIDITQPDTIRDWTKNIDLGRTVTVLAETGGQLIGYCSLHRSDILWTRHLGEIRLLVSSDYRGFGVGGVLARQIFAMARETDLQKLMVQMMSTQREAQGLFHNLGFIPEAMLHDWVIDRNARTHDLIVMSREVEDVELESSGAHHLAPTEAPADEPTGS